MTARDFTAAIFGALVLGNLWWVPFAIAFAIGG